MWIAGTVFKLDRTTPRTRPQGDHGSMHADVATSSLAGRRVVITSPSTPACGSSWSRATPEPTDPRRQERATTELIGGTRRRQLRPANAVPSRNATDTPHGWPHWAPNATNCSTLLRQRHPTRPSQSRARPNRPRNPPCPTTARQPRRGPRPLARRPHTRGALCGQLPHRLPQGSHTAKRQLNHAIFARITLRNGRIDQWEFRPPFDALFNTPQFEYRIYVDLGDGIQT
jgi:hypothetical protein